MSSEGAGDSFYRPNVRVIAVFDFDADTIVLFVERLYIAFNICENLVESVYISGDLPSQKIF